MSHPQVRVGIHEHEPIEAFALLADDDMDLALTYDYNLAPASLSPLLEAVPLWTMPWGLGVPTGLADGATTADLTRFRDHPWIVNSRNTADDDAVRTLASLAGFTPRITHEIDSLDLVEDLITAGHGVGLLPLARPPRDGVRVLAPARSRRRAPGVRRHAARTGRLVTAAGAARPAARSPGGALARRLHGE